MGSWGNRIFENDTALDQLGDVFDYLKVVIERDLKEAQTKSGRGDLLRPTPAAVAILAALAQRLPSARACLPRSEVDKWEREYFKWFDETFASAVSVDQMRAYRRNIKSEFRKLRKLLHENNV